LFVPLTVSLKLKYFVPFLCLWNSCICVLCWLLHTTRNSGENNSSADVKRWGYNCFGRNYTRFLSFINELKLSVSVCVCVCSSSRRSELFLRHLPVLVPANLLQRAALCRITMNHKRTERADSRRKLTKSFPVSWKLTAQGFCRRKYFKLYTKRWGKLRRKLQKQAKSRTGNFGGKWRWND
jgi:hypothetical protein